MPVVFLKSGGSAVCGGYTIKEGVVKMVDVTFKDAGVPEGKEKQPEAIVSLANVLYIIPGQ
ncbi:hypothetical protein HPY86_07705 [candidate division WOR-3 bacterium]|nr:hypothetical protein [candidate division WOR-3 bacterium]